MRFGARAFADSLAALAGFSLVDRVHEIACPVLVINGTHDFITPPAQGRRLVARIAGARFVELAHSGHFPFVEEPPCLSRGRHVVAGTGYPRRTRTLRVPVVVDPARTANMDPMSSHRILVGLLVVLTSSAAFATPEFYAYDLEISGHHSKTWIKTKNSLPKGTTLKLKVLAASQYTCAINIQTESKKLSMADRFAGFDCSKEKGKLNTELAFTTKNDGILAIAVGNYGEQITDVHEVDGGYEATWKDPPGKSVITIRVYE